MTKTEDNPMHLKTPDLRCSGYELLELRPKAGVRPSYSRIDQRAGRRLMGRGVHRVWWYARSKRASGSGFGESPCRRAASNSTAEEPSRSAPESRRA
jgi:hypothetical protein